MYEVQVRVKTLTVSECLAQYCCPEKFVPLCKTCPEYEKNWSCPTGVPDAEVYAGEYQYVQLIGLKVIYEDQIRQESMLSADREEELRQQTYGVAKKKLQQVLLALEEMFPDSRTIMAGKCELCERCARIDGKACRHPEWMRYSFSGLGFDLVKISEEVLGISLLWQKEGLPEYNVAVAAFLHK